MHLPVALLMLCLALPATGRRRRTSPEANRAKLTRENAEDRARSVARLVTPSSPYSTDRAPLDGAESRLSRPYLDSVPGMTAFVSPRPARVRPYWAARERAVRLSRRAVTVLAADFGIDVDTRNIHAVLSGVRAR